MRDKEVGTHIDLFSGPGGFCTGLRAAGFRTLAAVEKVGNCVDTYKANHPGVNVIHGDVREVTAEQLGLADGQEVTLLTAGFPCETFSTAGTKSRQAYDYRQFLFAEAIRLAKETRARFVLFENVPAIQSKKAYTEGDTLIIDLIREALAEAGYRNRIETVINAADLGVPQRRKRFFLFASRDDDAPLTTPLTWAGRGPYQATTCRDAISGLPPDECDVYLPRPLLPYGLLMFHHEFWGLGQPLHENKVPALTHHVRPKHKPTTVERFSLIPQGGRLADLYDSLPKEQVQELIARKVLPRVPFIQRGQRLHPGQISPTVTSHCLDELVHPTENRCLTVRECARLQSFPDAYRFSGALSNPHNSPNQDMYEQIGDAVPPLVAFHWGRVVDAVANGGRG